MTGISRIDKLNLFKRLIKYSNQLVYTDKQFYLHRVKQEFNQNKSLNDEEDIKFFYQVSIIFNVFVYLTHVLRNGIQLQFNCNSIGFYLVFIYRKDLRFSTKRD